MESFQILLAFFLATTAFYGFTLSLVLIFKKNDLPNANRILSFVVLIFAIFLIAHALGLSVFEYDTMRFMYLVGTLWYALPPLIYIHVTYLLKPTSKVSFWWLFHSIPILLHLVNVIPFYTQLNELDQINWLQEGKQKEDWLHLIMTSGYVFLIQILLYLPLTIRKMNLYIDAHKNRIAKNGLSRIKYIRNSYVVFSAISLLMETLALFSVRGPWFILLLLTFVIIIFSLAYISISNPSVLFSQIPFKWSFRSKELPDEEIPFYVNLLTQKIEEKVIYDPELTLDKLATKIDLTPRQLSNLIKKQYGQGFPDFLNHHRVEAAKDLLLDTKYSHWSMLAIGLEVGFNSKSTFNRVFKKLVGKTPTEYLNAMKKSVGEK